MKISCNIIEDLLPLYVDDMVSEDSRQLVEEHLKACPTCRRMQEEIMRENHLTDVKKGSDSVQTNKMEAELLKKIRCKIRKKENCVGTPGSCHCSGSRWNRALLVL